VLGFWVLGHGLLGPIPNPQSPIPNPQSPIPNPHLSNKIQNIIKLKKIIKNINK
jgi:hypothetical protein